MKMNGYDVLAGIALVMATALGITGLVVGLSAAEVVAVTAPFVGIAGTVIGRGRK